MTHERYTGYVTADAKVVRLCLRHGLISKEIKERFYPLTLAPKWATIVVPALSVEAPLAMPCLRLLAELDDPAIIPSLVGAAKTCSRPRDLVAFIADLVEQKCPDNRKRARALTRSVSK